MPKNTNAVAGGREFGDLQAEERFEVNPSEDFSVVLYANVLHQHGVDSMAAKQFRRERVGDPVFQGRATVLEDLIKIAQQKESVSPRSGVGVRD